MIYLKMNMGDDIMKKIIIIEDENHTKNKKFKKLVNNRFVSWLLYMLGYAIVLISVSLIFRKSFYIDSSYYGLYAFLAAIIIYLLNQTIKPILFYITLPITAITFGLFYPLLNVFILDITSFILGKHFQIHGIILPFIIAIIISILNMFMEGMIIKPLIHKGEVKK